MKTLIKWMILGIRITWRSYVMNLSMDLIGSVCPNLLQEPSSQRLDGKNELG